ncbi:MAG: methylenetetrahydrofolate reductase [Geminicoccaceae bacterium]|nr:methylenetetrahydrofolate reductase [Geminicoccaceae bacterium]
MLATLTRGFSRAAPAEGLRERIRAFMAGFSIETTPKQAEKVASFAAVLPKGTRVFVAFIPGESPAAIVALAERLRGEGMVPVPHVPARSLEDMAAFVAYAKGLRAAGVTEALVLAGGLGRPVGDLVSSMQLLDSGVFEDLGFERLHVAGHPEGSPDIDAKGLAEALAHKNAWSERTGIPLTITTQFGFDGTGMLAWAGAIEAAGNRLPIRIGVAGPASMTALLKYAKMCGVNASMTVMAKAGGKLLQLMGQSAPDGLITLLATESKGGIQNLHFYPFGGFDKTAKWATAVAEGRFVLDRSGDGFTVEG